MFPGWRRTKSAATISHSGTDKRVDVLISQLVAKPVPLFVEPTISRPDTPTNSPTKRANSISPVRIKPPSPYLSSRDKQNRKRRSQTGPPSISPTRVNTDGQIGQTSGSPPSRTQSDLPHLSQALHPPQTHSTPTTQLQSISSSSGILSSSSIFSAYADSTSSVATSGSEQIQPIHSDLDQAIQQHESKSPVTRPSNLPLPGLSSSRRALTSKVPSPYKQMHPDFAPKSPHKLHMFWGPQQSHFMSYNEKFTRPFTETVDEFCDPSLVTVPSHVTTVLQVNQENTANCEVQTRRDIIHLKQTPSVDSLASSTVNIITSYREELQDLIAQSSATSITNRSDGSPDLAWAQKQSSRESLVVNKQSWGSGSVSRMLDFCCSYLDDELVGPCNSSPASPVTPQDKQTEVGRHPLTRSRALSSPVERTVTAQKSLPLSTNLINENLNRDIFLLTSNIIPVPTAAAPSPLIPPAHKFSLKRLHSLPNRSNSSHASSSTTHTYTDQSTDSVTRKFSEEFDEIDNAFDQPTIDTEMRNLTQTLDPRVKCFRRKSSSFSSITSEHMLEENQNTESIFYPKMSDRRKTSLERLQSLEIPMRENIAFKTELRKYVIMNLFDTEMSYVRSLEAIIKDNGERLTMLVQLHNPMLQSTLESLLEHLTLIFNKHKSFLTRVETAYKSYNKMTTIGGIIWHHFSQPALLDTYLKYIQCYQALIDTLRTGVSKNPSKQKKNPNPKDPFEKLTLTDLLIQPIQRPSRYPLIIKDLQKQSIPGSSEYQQLANALLQVGNFTMKMNTFLKKDIPSGPEVLKELELMIDGLENLTKPNRMLLRLGGDFVTETKSPIFYLSPRRDKCLFLFSDLILLCSSRPKSASIVRASSFSGDANHDLAKRKLKLIWEAPLHKVSIENNVSSETNREKTKADKHLEKLLEDEKRMTEMLEQLQDLNYGNNNIEKVLTESLHQLQAQIYEKRLKLPSYSACLTLVDLQTCEKRIIVFADEQTKLDWVKAYKEARGKQESERQELSWSIEKKEAVQLPNFLNPLMLMESRSGMEATCACQVETTCPDITSLWVCRSDQFGGQVVELLSQYGALPNVKASYTVSPSPILCITSVPNMSCELNPVIEEPQRDLSAVLIQEEALRYRPYSAKTISERRSVYYRYARPSSGRYSAMSTYTESLIETATLSKCSSASNLSEVSSSRGHRLSGLEQLESSFSGSQWNESPLYVETSRHAGDLISMVSGSVNSLTTTSEYDLSLQSLLGENGRLSCGRWRSSSLEQSIDANSRDKLVELTGENLECRNGTAGSEESLILPAKLMQQITTLENTQHDDSNTKPEISTVDQAVISKYERFGVKQTSPEATNLDNRTESDEPPNNVQRLIQQFSPEKSNLPKEMFPNMEDTETDYTDNIDNIDNTPLIDGLTGENNSPTQPTTTFPTPGGASPVPPLISPDISHYREDSRERNRLWLQSSFNKSNPQLVASVILPEIQTPIDQVNQPSTPTIQLRTDKEFKNESGKKQKVEKKSSFNKLQIPKIFSAITRNSSPKNREITAATTSSPPNPLATQSETNLTRSESLQSDIQRSTGRTRLKIEGPTVWVGTQSGGLIVFQSDANIRTQSKHTIKLTHPVYSICYHRSKVFVGLGNGHMMVFSYSKVSQEWLESEKRQVSYIDHQLLCITSVQQETLWVAEANRVHVFAGDVFKFPVKKFSLWPKQRNSSLIVISQMVYDGNEGVWVCLDREPTLHLYSILTYSQILQVDCMEPTMRLIKDKILYKHMSDQFRIASIHSSKEGTWVGVSSGVLAFISTPKYDARACQVIEPPCIYPSFHGHTAGVKFIVPWKHKFLESKTREILVTGGIGYEYRGNTKYPIEFERDIHNSGTVLIWSP